MPAQTNLPNRWKRVGLSFASAIAADIIIIGAVATRNAPGAKWDGFLLMSSFALCFILPAWLLTLPAVILIDKLNGWRLAILIAIGCLIGPTATAAMNIWSLHENPTQIPHWPGVFDYFALAISITATILYLTILKLNTRIQPTS